MPNLVGIGLSQVPTNSMLGGMAYQDPEHASIKELDLKNLSQINSEIADTAVDIFVYDTRKDSDGGAWRKRTQNTSWYNETLNTATRGSRKEFPAVAVIVSTTTKVTIYDGDDPDLPMWMVFTAGIGGMSNRALLQYTGQNGYHLAALNGVLVLGHDTSSDNYGSPIINFISEYIVRMDPHSTEGGIFNGGVAQRNDNVGYGSPGQIIIINSIIKDVAMTVLPNAPIDSATGLPIPTIAVATASGVSIIKDDGNVADTTSSNNGYTHVRSVEWASNGDLLFVMGDTNGYLDYLHTYDGFNSNDNVISIDTKNGSTKNVRSSFRHAGTTTAYASHQYDGFTVRGSDGAPNYAQLHPVAKKDPFEYGVKSPQGLTHISENPNSKGSLVAYATTTYNTGYMHGDIKGAFLSDTDTTNATELITNGYFNSDVSGWTTGSTGTTATLSVNRMLVTAPSSGSSWGYVYQAITTEIGKTYKIELYYDRGTVDGRIVVRNDSSNVSAGLLKGVGVNAGGWRDLGASDDAKTIYATFTATATTTYILLYAKSTSGGTSVYDRVSVTLEKDRSVNNKGLRVYGTITKSAVATGADLVANSGWSTANFLVQSYNSDFNFHTGDFCIALWTKRSNASTQVILERGNGASNVFYLYISASNDIRFSCGNQGTSVYGNIGNTDWNQIIIVRRSGLVYGYLNGELTSVNSNAQSVTSTDSDLYLGKTVSNQYPYSGSIALVRISGTAPSPEQVKKMYEDEKCLFHENAKATLYGSSDAVTALAFDDTTNLLHVGTSAGRSEFQGLRRINNTTTAVTTAISASNGLVAEQ